MSRLQTLFSSPKEKVIPFITAGYPNIDSTVDLALACAEAGADMIEIGIPFSDPLADGPVIQASSQKALENGITVEKILQQVRKIRNSTDVPLVLMGYINPIFRLDCELFIDYCREVGVDGLIIPDLPFHEAGNFCELLQDFSVVSRRIFRA